VDTLETAVPWSGLPDLAADLGRTLRHGLDAVDERVHAFSHLSHVYPSGSSLYTSLVLRLASDPDETLERWRLLKTAAGETTSGTAAPSATSTESGATIAVAERRERSSGSTLESRPATRSRRHPERGRPPPVTADHVLAIDVGTQSVRASSTRRQPGGRGRVPIEPYVSPQPGWAEQDPELYWRAIGDVARRCSVRAVPREAIAH
jgi:hypothetical protein